VSQEWYYSVDGGRQGPVSPAELKKLAEAGKISESDLVWKDGMADWVAAKSIKGLFGGGSATPSGGTAAKTGEQAAAMAADDDERPSSRGRSRVNDDDDRPRRRRDADEDDDRPRSRRRDEEDEEEEDRPVRRRRDEDEEDRPRKKKRRIPEDAANQKMTAAIVAIITSVLGLGFIGIHKFMLGKTKAGLIMLLGSILTCGIGAIAFNVIALIEGIIYITKTDEEFYETYVIGDKEWF